MKTQDAFLTMLGQLDAPAAPRVPPIVPRVLVAPPGASKAPATPLAAARPDFASDIDAIVQAMVAVGDIVLDAGTDSYRRPHYRRFRFGEVQS